MSIECRLDVRPSCFVSQKFTASIEVVEPNKLAGLLVAFGDSKGEAKEQVLLKARKLFAALQKFLIENGGVE